MSQTVAVNEKEYELLTLTRAIMGAANGQVGVLLRTARADPTGLSQAGLQVFQRTLSMGVVRCLAFAGGARKEVFSAKGADRLWNRFGADVKGKTPKLEFTNATWDLIRWALVNPLSYSNRRYHSPDPEANKLPSTVTASGDVAVVFLLARLLVANDLSDVLREPIFLNNPLVQMAYADRVAPIQGTTKLPDFIGFFNKHSLLVEGFTQWIAEGIVAADKAPNTFDAAINVSQHRRAVYAEWMKAATSIKRRDLCLCLVDAGVRAMGLPAPVAISDPTAAMRDRAAASRAGVVLPEIVVTLSDWANQLAIYDFFDVEYRDAVNLRARWAKLGDARVIADTRIAAVAGI